jgi:hypothetical protein
MSKATAGFPRQADGLVNVPGVGLLVFDRGAGNFNQADAGNADAKSADNILGVTPYALDGAAADMNRIRAAESGDAQTTGILTSWGYNGATFDRPRTNSAANLADTTQPFELGTAGPGEWALNHCPNANIQATITKAAGGAGVRHVLRSFLAIIMSNTAVANTAILQIRDGASGAGTILYCGRLTVGAISSELFLAGLNLFGSENTAMTIEFNAAGGANVMESVSMSGYSTV